MTKGTGIKIESYVSKHSDAVFSHGICPVCSEKLYPEMYERIKARKGLTMNKTETSTEDES